MKFLIFMVQMLFIASIVTLSSTKSIGQASLPDPNKDGDCFYCLGYQPNTVVQILCWDGTGSCSQSSCTNGFCHD
jgi:hypothetical protein